MMFSSTKIGKFQNFKTPFYYYDISLLEKTIVALKQEAGKRNYLVHYAMKANANEKILKIISKNGLGADCVSGNEISKAIEVGFPGSKIAFAGVGKSDEEIKTGLQNNIFSFNVESLQEIEIIDSIAGSMNKVAPVALRINPDIDPKTHHYITTGLEENKFGLNFDDLKQIAQKIFSYKNLELIGIHFHIGSQVTDLEVYKSLCLRINEIQKWFTDHNIEIKHLNAGGGLGIDYKNPDDNLIPDFRSFFSVFEKFLELQPGQILHFEIGRAIVAQCGLLISKVLYIKEGINTNFAILDAGMTELLRPALYQAYHKIQNLTSNGKEKRYDVVGPICESSDTFAKSYLLPETKRGDLIAIRSTGAYGEVMASHYNLRPAIESHFSDQI